MKELVLPEILIRKLEEIYGNIQEDYDRVARELEFSCNGCPDNCCDSYFLHHTYAEWAYLWEGVRQLDGSWRDAVMLRARVWLEQCNKILAMDKRPQVMCPLNENGLCVLYNHRLLVCRTHGVPAWITRPDGRELRFPGCFRCQEIVAEHFQSPGQHPPPHVDRTELLHELAMLENQLLRGKRHVLPKVRLTIAEMLLQGPPPTY